ncbi:hypothetical protein GCM10023196_046510 [Actinoallomurus vinaceus]|uniref:Uncharacterized protein n=1 Tax=Actinoallomurus vinaceus TaxID=1080074 RepID=A0ABP8UC67_9ACTN
MNSSNMPPHPNAPLTRRVNWPMATVLTAIALVRPVFSIVGLDDRLGKPATPLVLTAAISLAWILIAGLSRVREPVLTLIAAGVGYGLAAIVLSAILSPILTGRLQGPLANPIAIVPVIGVNALWGGVCGACALGLQRMRGVRP